MGTRKTATVDWFLALFRYFPRFRKRRKNKVTKVLISNVLLQGSCLAYDLIARISLY